MIYFVHHYIYCILCQYCAYMIIWSRKRYVLFYLPASLADRKYYIIGSSFFTHILPAGIVRDAIFTNFNSYLIILLFSLFRTLFQTIIFVYVGTWKIHIFIKYNSFGWLNYFYFRYIPQQIFEYSCSVIFPLNLPY